MEPGGKVTCMMENGDTEVPHGITELSMLSFLWLRRLGSHICDSMVIGSNPRTGRVISMVGFRIWPLTTVVPGII